MKSAAYRHNRLFPHPGNLVPLCYFCGRRRITMFHRATTSREPLAHRIADANREAAAQKKNLHGKPNYLLRNQSQNRFGEPNRYPFESHFRPQKGSQRRPDAPASRSRPARPETPIGPAKKPRKSLITQNFLALASPICDLIVRGFP